MNLLKEFWLNWRVGRRLKKVAKAFELIKMIFVEQLSTGANLSKNSPALVLRNRILDQGSSVLKKEISNAFYIKAINAHITGKEIKNLRMSEGEPFPELI